METEEEQQASSPPATPAQVPAGPVQTTVAPDPADTATAAEADAFRGGKVSGNVADDAFAKLQGIRVAEAWLKFIAKIVFGLSISALIVVQNCMVFRLAWTAYWGNRTQEISTLLAVIVPATLIETAALVHTMIKWIFTDTDYKRQE